jgi:hypothetical protein
METAPIGESIETVVRELDDLLNEETAALKRLDHETIDALTSRKVILLRRMGAASRAHVSPAALPLIADVRQKALNNQLLLVHARDLIRGVLETWAPHRVGASGALLEVRG